MQPAKSLKLGILALLFVALTIFPGCGGTVPPVNHSPTIIILTADSSSINISQSDTITCIATDQDGDALAYIWTKNGGTISGSGSAITWTAPATTGTYIITCTVSDGNGGQDSESVNVEVFELDDKTKIINSINGLFQAFNDKDWNTAKSYCVYGSEIYQEIVGAEQCYNLYGAYECDIPDEFIVNNINPIIINSNYAEAYVYLTIIAGGIGDSGELWLYLQKINNDWRLYGAGGVTPVNQAPEITSTAVTSATVGEAYTYDVDATDSNGDTLTYSLNAGPAGMTIEVHIGVINWAPTVADVGIHSVIVEVSDGELTDTQSFVITVLAVEQEFQDNQEMITHHLEEIAEQGKTPEQYAQELASLIMNESQVSKVEVFGNSVNLTYASGKIHFIRFTDKEEGDEGYLIGGGSLHSSSALRDLLFKERDEVLFRGSSYQQREESSAIPLEERTIGIQDFTISDQFRQTSSQEKLLQNRNILVWSPFTIYADALYLDLSLRLLGEDHLGFNIDLIRYKEATMDSLKEITNYGMVFLFAHGSLPDGDSIITGEEITKDNEYKMYIKGISYTTEWKVISTPPFIEKKPDHFAVDYEWISNNVPKNANNKIVIANSCHLGNENMWEAFKSIGAGDYFGWDADCTLPCVINRSADLLLKLKYGDSNTEDAYEPYSCSPYGANWVRFGDPVRFAVSNNPPIISDLSANPPSVNVDQPTTITCIASDPDGDHLTYNWTVNAGSFEGDTSGPSVTWRAPSTADIYIVVSCEVSDGKGGEDSESINIVVKPDEKEEIENVLEKFGSAMDNENWGKAKTYCVPNSQAVVSVDEYASAINELNSICDEWDVQCNWSSNEGTIVISGSNATATTPDSSCTMTCVVGTEEFSVSGSGYDTYYLKKIDGSWLISEIGGNAVIDPQNY